MHMVHRSNLGGDCIFHPPPGPLGLDMIPNRIRTVMGTCTHNGDSTSDRKVWLQCVPFPKSNKSLSNMVLHMI